MTLEAPVNMTIFFLIVIVVEALTFEPSLAVAVMVAWPALTGVITPLLLTLAIDSLLLFQVRLWLVALEGVILAVKDWVLELLALKVVLPEKVIFSTFLLESDGVGVEGVEGDEGVLGVDGVEGVLGVDGVEGVLGVEGVDGVEGSLGVGGSLGVLGVDGADGVLGVEGSLGVLGVDGVDGVLGVISRQLLSVSVG